MVPPPSAAALAPDPFAGLVARLRQVFAFAKERGLVFVHLADPSPIGRLLAEVRSLSPGAAWCASGAELLALPHGSTALLLLREEDFGGLNLLREQLRTRSLRVVFVGVAEVGAAFRDAAPDLYDWTAHRFDLSSSPPRWVVETVATILGLNGRFAWWGPGTPDPVLSAVNEWPVHVCDAEGAWPTLVEAAARPGWRVWRGVRFAADEARVRWAEATARAEGAVVLDRPALDLPGWWRVHAEVAAIGTASEEELATAYEPEAMGRRAACLPEEPAWAANVEGPSGARALGPAIRAITPGSWSEARASALAQVGAGLEAGWPGFAVLPSFGAEDTGFDDDALSRAIGRLPLHAASFLVERALRTGAAVRARVEAAIDGRHADVARAWTEELPHAEQGWKPLFAILTEEGEATFRHVAALEALRAKANGGLAAAIDHRLGQARFDALDLAGAREALARASRSAGEWWRRWDARHLDAVVAERMDPLPEVERAAARLVRAAERRGDVVRGARGRTLWGQVLRARGRRTEALSVERPGVFAAALADRPVPPSAWFTEELPRLPARGRAGRLRKALLELRETGEFRLDDASPLERVDVRLRMADEFRSGGDEAIAELAGRCGEAGDRAGALLATVLVAEHASYAWEWGSAARMAEEAFRLAEMRADVRVGVRAAALRVWAARSQFDADAADRAWGDWRRLLRDATDPELRARFVAAGLDQTLPPAAVRELERALEHAFRHPDAESDGAGAHLRALCVRALARAASQLEGVSATGPPPEIRRQRNRVRRLRALTERYPPS